MITPDIPDLSGLESSIQELNFKLDVTNAYLNYIFCGLIWVIILMVCTMLFRLLHNTLFKKNDFLN